MNHLDSMTMWVKATNSTASLKIYTSPAAFRIKEKTTPYYIYNIYSHIKKIV